MYGGPPSLSKNQYNVIRNDDRERPIGKGSSQRLCLDEPARQSPWSVNPVGGKSSLRILKLIRQWFAQVMGTTLSDHSFSI